MPRRSVDRIPSQTDKSNDSKADLMSRTDSNVKVLKNSGDPPVSPRMRRNMERVEMLARPPARRLRSLWDEKCAILPKARRDKIKSALEEEYFLSPELVEHEEPFFITWRATRLYTTSAYSLNRSTEAYPLKIQCILTWRNEPRKPITFT
ncbi:unnamed protein product [Diatraea saccharalis]|uniref:Uncharacterized protein n=1 Tax=Diatraea saccharalis TaxID=40085 RepID=A0A9N9R1M7_9NEOP|nr:unnamed protein product [Diatraea saccharalis]